MSQALLGLTNGELRRLAACLRSQPEVPNEAALSQHQVAIDSQESKHNLLTWLASWHSNGGSNTSLNQTIDLLLEQRQLLNQAQAELVWSGPQVGAGDITRDQAVLIREMVDRCEQRLLITTFNIWREGFIADLLERIQNRMEVFPGLDARVVLNIPRPKNSTVLAEQLRGKFVVETWNRLWIKAKPMPKGYFDPRSLELNRTRPTVFHVKSVVADDELLVTSANLSDSAQLDNCELGVHFSQGNSAGDAWNHFDRLIHCSPPALAPIEEPLRSLEH